MRLTITILGVLATVAAGGFALFYVLVIQPVEQVLAPATPQTARVELLADQPNAVILMPFVTGDVPRLVQGEALQRLSPQLWFTGTTDAGNIIAGSIFMLMGVPPLQEIATTFRDGAPLTRHNCLTIGCMHWPTTQGDQWGMGGLKLLGNALGPQVEERRETFHDHAAYLRAHAAVTANPGQWLTDSLDARPRPPPDGMREVSITLPSRIVRTNLDGSQTFEDEEMRAEVEALARSILEGTGGRIEAVSGITALPFWALKDDDHLRTSDGAMRAIPNLALLNPHLTLRVPEAQAERVVAMAHQKAGAGAWPPPDLDAINQAIAQAFRTWSINPGCLPACGSASPAQPLQLRSQIILAPPPTWTLVYWALPVDQPQ